VGVFLLGSLLAASPAWAHKTSPAPAHAHPAGAAPATPTLADYDAHLLNVGGDFTLRNQDGRLTRLRDFRSQVVLLFFGYTYCPDLCPITTAKMAHLQRTLAEQGTRMQSILVSIDPERDTPARLKTYLANFDGRIVGLTGTADAVRRAADLFRVRAVKQEAPNLDPYLVSHTQYLFLLDGHGRLRYIFPADVDDTLLAEGVRQLARG
jgi:protein SCO1/2